SLDPAARFPARCGQGSPVRNALDYAISTRATRLQARLHVPARLGGDDTALLDGILFGADNLQVERAGIAVLVQDADIADQVDVATAVGLILRLARALLATLAVTNMHVLDTADDRGNGLNRILAGAIDVRWVHVHAKGRRRDGIHHAQRRRRVVDGLPHMRLDTERDAVAFGHVGQRAQLVDGLHQARLVVGLTARAAVDDGHAQLGCGLHGLRHLG